MWVAGGLQRPFTSLYVKLIGITAEARRDYTIVTKNSQDPGIQSAGEAIIIITIYGQSPVNFVVCKNNVHVYYKGKINFL